MNFIADFRLVPLSFYTFGTSQTLTLNSDCFVKSDAHATDDCVCKADSHSRFSTVPLILRAIVCILTFSTATLDEYTLNE